MNALWNHFVFPVIGTAKRAFIFNLSAPGCLLSLPAPTLGVPGGGRGPIAAQALLSESQKGVSAGELFKRRYASRNMGQTGCLRVRRRTVHRKIAMP
jgi:hypothetical protein